MVAQVEFFCSPREEDAVLRYLRGSGDVVAFPVTFHRPATVPITPLQPLPPWPEPFDVFIWLRSAGPLVWHTERPTVAGDTHGQLVNRLFASDTWDNARRDEGLALLDVDLSPVLVYRRALSVDGQVGPCLLLSRASNLDRVSPEFARWVRRVQGWVRRNAKRIHDWRSKNPSIPNPHMILNSIYAFPDALAEIQSGAHHFAILLR